MQLSRPTVLLTWLLVPALASSGLAQPADPQPADPPPLEMPPPVQPAQPAQPPAQPAQPPAQQGPRSPVLAPPAFADGQTLAPWERRILAQGPISNGQTILGGILGTWWGFGIGHAIQGRWSDGGSLFCIGELAALGIGITGLVNGIGGPTTCDVVDGVTICSESRSGSEDLWMGLAIGGLVTYGVLRIWEMIDVWAGPGRHNDLYRQIRRKAGYSQPRWGFMLAPTPRGGSAFAQLRF